MATTTKQNEVLTSLARNLVKTLEGNPEFEIQVAAVTDFITGAVDPGHLLGDGDLIRIAVRVCRHHGKHNADITGMLQLELGRPE